MSPYYKGKKVTPKIFLELKYKDKPSTLKPKLKQLEEKIQVQKEKKLKQKLWRKQVKRSRQIKKEKQKIGLQEEKDKSKKIDRKFKRPPNTCMNCKISFRGKIDQLFCCRKCYLESKTKHKKHCLNCKKIFYPDRINHRYKFCCKLCAWDYHYKNRMKNECPKCGSIKKSKSKLCRVCNNNLKMCRDSKTGQFIKNEK